MGVKFLSFFTGSIFCFVLWLGSSVLSVNRNMKNFQISSTSAENSNNLEQKLFQNPNNVILKYVKVPFDLSYGSNSIPLVVSCLIAGGNFLELGMGSFSTPILHDISIDQNCQAYSVDTNLGWVNKFKSYNKSTNHKLFYVNNYENLEEKLGFNLTKIGVVLVDHIDAGRRAEHAKQFSNRSKIVIVHDAEKRNDDFYRYEKSFLRSFFKYACKFSLYQNQQKTFYISTLILSNFINLNQMEQIFKNIKTEYGHVACNLNL